jgi:hypothetical protein
MEFKVNCPQSDLHTGETKLEIRNNVKCPKFKTQNAPALKRCVL